MEKDEKYVVLAEDSDSYSFYSDYYPQDRGIPLRVIRYSPEHLNQEQQDRARFIFWKAHPTRTCIYESYEHMYSWDQELAERYAKMAIKELRRDREYEEEEERIRRDLDRRVMRKEKAMIEKWERKRRDWERINEGKGVVQERGKKGFLRRLLCWKLS